MSNKPVRLVLVSVVAVLSVFGLSQTPAAASAQPEGGLRAAAG